MNPTCYRCGQPGHTKRNCPSSAKFPPGTAPQATPGAPPVTKREELPEWCGTCDEDTRLETTVVIPPGETKPLDIIRRCPNCHPYRGQGCGKHVTPPGQPCQLCRHGVRPGLELEYIGPPPKPPAPFEPGDLLTMTVEQMNAERKDLLDHRQMPTRIGGRTEREEQLLREMAARQAAQSRRQGINGMFREPESQFRPERVRHTA